MDLTTSIDSFRVSKPETGKWSTCLDTIDDAALTDWTLDQLHLKPYQHILEVNYGSGYALQEAARKLKVGFLAGIDESVKMYRKAYARNKKLIRQQMLQLHLGEIHELPYPHHYFHTIFARQSHLPWKEPALRFIQLGNLLKSGGRLVMVLQPGRDLRDPNQEAEHLKWEFQEAGFVRTRLEFYDLHSSTGIAAIGFRE